MPFETIGEETKRDFKSVNGDLLLVSTSDSSGKPTSIIFFPYSILFNVSMSFNDIGRYPLFNSVLLKDNPIISEFNSITAKSSFTDENK